MAMSIMLQGTASHVGKSILTAALCRIFKQDGYRVAPFKAQNMALNSYVTKDGGEMGRAQVAQAEACGIEPQVEMNPILLKPTGNASSQVVVLGKPVGNMSAQEYHQTYNITALDIVEASYNKLADNYQIVVLEGAGSPAEVNLKARDIVNMRMAKLAKAPVLLVADIDRGGALAAVVGTLALLDPDEVDLVAGIIINKFRGDVKLLEPALTFLEEKTGKPVLGVIPMLTDVGVADEDSVSRENDSQIQSNSDNQLDVVVVSLPRISNFTDFDCFAGEADVSLRYVKQAENLGEPDLVIIPGSKNTIEDMQFLHQTGWTQALTQLASKGTPLIGICGGYQILGQELADPLAVESTMAKVSGLGLLPIKTSFFQEKLTRQVEGTICATQSPLLAECADLGIVGYEIHMGESQPQEQLEQVALIRPVTGEIMATCPSSSLGDGAIGADGLVIGTYIHGFFDSDQFRRQFLNNLRKLKGWAPLSPAVSSYHQVKEEAYNRLAQQVRANLDMDRIYSILGQK